MRASGAQSADSAPRPGTSCAVARLRRGRAVTAESVAALVERGDRERWRTAMAAPPAARPGLLALYAFNLEIARAPWAASEPMLGAIRLRWWLDAIAAIYDGALPPHHEVAEPLAAAILADDLPRRLFEEMIAARLADAEPGPLPDLAAVGLYVDHTAGHLMELAARHLGAEGAALPVVRDFARGAGIAALLRALPELRARGRDPLPPEVAPAILARDGLAAIERARSRRDRVPRAAAPALLPGWQADRVLARVAQDPTAIRPGGLETSEAAARGLLLWRAFTGRW
jgi:phytoene synthase